MAEQNPSLLHEECTAFLDIVRQRSEVFSKEDKLAIAKLAYKLDRMYKSGSVILKVCPVVSFLDCFSMSVFASGGRVLRQRAPSFGRNGFVENCWS